MGFRADRVRGGDGPGEIDYRLARHAVLSEFRKGRVARHEICDAHPELLRAAREVGEPTSLTCPVCEETKVVLVSHVFGPRLPAFGRCITTRKELQTIAKRPGEFSCYVVEVCPVCSWNHLARTFLLSPARARGSAPGAPCGGACRPPPSFGNLTDRLLGRAALGEPTPPHAHS